MSTTTTTRLGEAIRSLIAEHGAPNRFGFHELAWKTVDRLATGRILKNPRALRELEREVGYDLGRAEESFDGKRTRVYLEVGGPIARALGEHYEGTQS